MIYKAVGHTFSRLKEAIAYAKANQDKFDTRIMIASFDSPEDKEFTEAGCRLYWEDRISWMNGPLKKYCIQQYVAIMSGMSDFKNKTK